MKKRAIADIYARANDSFCVVEKFIAGDSLVGVWVEFGGAAGQIPSTSNSRMIRQTRLKTGKVVPMLMRKPAHQEKLNLLSKLYYLAWAEKKEAPPRFEETNVFVLAQLGTRPGRWDSHNMSKPIGDWLQDVELINDDARAEILCIKKKDYPGMTVAPNTTQIIIQPRQQVKSLLEQYLYEIGRASTGYQYIG